MNPKISSALREHPELAPLVFQFEKILQDAKRTLTDDEYREFLLDAKALLQERKP